MAADPATARINPDSAVAPWAPTPDELKTKPSDWYLVAGLAVASVVFAILYYSAGFWPFKVPLWAACLMSVLISLPLLVRRRWPALAAWIQCTIYSVALILGAVEPGVSQIMVFLGIYAIGAWQADRHLAFVTRIVLYGALFVLFSASMIIKFSSTETTSIVQFAASVGVSFLSNVAFFGGAWIFGNRAWNQRILLNELRTANDEVQAQERQLAQQSLDLERVSIARELHDGVAHLIAGVGIHAAAARRSLEKNPEKVRESLLVIESSARQTVEELRSLVYTLRDSDTQPHSAAPTQRNPSLGDIPELITQVRSTGRQVALSIVGDPSPLTPLSETTIYRVIQESLTNVQRYAGQQAQVEVRLRYVAEAVEIEVSNSGSGTAAGSLGTGMGIIGMRERVTALDGTLSAGPKTRGGWLVRARIPNPGQVDVDAEDATDHDRFSDHFPTKTHQ